MSKDKAKKDKPLSAKKEFRTHIMERLKTALNGLEEKVGKKELENRIKKATKLLVAGVKLKPAKAPKSKAPKKEDPGPGTE